VEWTYGKGCPPYGMKVRRNEDFTDEKLASLSRRELTSLSQSLGVGAPASKLEGDDAKAYFQQIRENAFKGDSFDHSLWDEVLKSCIGRGEIQGIELNTFDYKKLVEVTEGKGGGKLGDKFNKYLDNLAHADIKTLSVNHQMALLMNAYNALCVSIIVRAMREGKEVKSIQDLGSGDKKVWDITAGTLGGKEITLTELEHRDLRQQWAEPCLHACIVCASLSCPDLRGEAYKGDATLGSQMDDQMRKWLLNPKKGMEIKKSSRTVRLSSIFNWFSRDFKPRPLPFLQKYMTEEMGKAVSSTKMKIEFMEYKWVINAPDTD